MTRYIDEELIIFFYKISSIYQKSNQKNIQTNKKQEDEVIILGSTSLHIRNSGIDESRITSNAKYIKCRV